MSSMKPFSAPIPRVPRDRRDDRYQAGRGTAYKHASSGWVKSVQDDGTVTVVILDEVITGVIYLDEEPPVGAICEVESRGDLLVIPVWFVGPNPGGPAIPVYIGSEEHSDGTTHSLLKPSGTTAGDLVIMHAHASGGAGSVDPDPRIRGRARLSPSVEVAWAVLDETAAPFTFTTTGAFLDWTHAAMVGYRDVRVGTVDIGPYVAAAYTPCAVMSSVQAVVVLVAARSGTVAPAQVREITTPANYTKRNTSKGTYDIAAYFEWKSSSLGSNPYSEFNTDGTPGMIGAVTLELVDAA